MSDQIQDRKNKLEKLRGLGVDPYGGRFENVIRNGDIRAAAEKLTLENGQISEAPEARFRAAGRVVLHRDIGKLIFMTVRDWSGDLQWGVSKNMLVAAVAATGAAAPSEPQAQARGASEPAVAGQGAKERRSEGAEVPNPKSKIQNPKSASPSGDAPTSGEPQDDGGWQVAKLLDLGDIVGADGKLGRTKTGELTLWVTNLRILSKALRPPPEKYHGLTDVEARYRRRYVDLFANPDSQKVFLLRARIIDHARDVLRRRGFIEVDTPVLQPIYGGAAARPFITHHNTLDLQLYLRISPELYLKRLLVGGLERVYEFSRCFRNEGISPRHNPEFTMLELYQAYGDYHDMMDITEEIIAGAAKNVIGTYRIGTKGRRDEGANVGDGTGDGEQGTEDGVIDYAPPWPRRKYADLVREYAGVDINDESAVRAKHEAVFHERDKAIRAASASDRSALGSATLDPGVTADPSKIQNPKSKIAEGHAPPDGVVHSSALHGSALHGPAFPPKDHAVLVNELFEHFVEPHLINPTFVIDYPAPLCPLTRRHPDDPRIALRFEVYLNGMEMGNAYTELNDPAIQRENFGGAVAGEGDETMRVMDEDFCEALEYAMPPAGGLGIGIDRMVMLLTGSASIRDVLLFPLQRAER